MLTPKTQPQIERAEVVKIINMNKDAVVLYGIASKKVKNNALKNTLIELEIIHLNLIERLQQYLGGSKYFRRKAIKPHETFIGGTQRLLGEIEAQFSNAPEKVFIRNLKDLEERCLHYLEQTLYEKILTKSLKQSLYRELQELRRTYEYMKSIKESATAVD